MHSVQKVYLYVHSPHHILIRFLIFMASYDFVLCVFICALIGLLVLFRFFVIFQNTYIITLTNHTKKKKFSKFWRRKKNFAPT